MRSEHDRFESGVKKGMEEQSREFAERGNEIYAKAENVVD